MFEDYPGAFEGDDMPTYGPRAAIGLGSLVLSLGLLAGCATSPPAVVYGKPGVVASDRERDENACLRSSVGLDDQGYILVPFHIDREAYQRCMEARGYIAGPKR